MVRRTLILAAVVLVAGAAWAAEPQRWLNVDVVESGDDTTVKVHVPLNLVLALLDAVNTDEMAHGRIDLHLEDAEVDWPAVMRAMRDAPDGEFVQIESRDADVQVSKRGGVLSVTVSERGDDEQVEVTLPEVLLDALVIDDDNRLDVKALIAGLDRVPGGELVRVRSADANIRVWVE